METPDPKYKHKPSEKHTLEEVLKSLQDLIRNDLAEGASGTARPIPAPAGSRQREDTARGSIEVKSRRETTAGLREDFAPVSPGSGPVNLDAVMRSLKDLIGNELNAGDEPKPPETKSGTTHEEYLVAEDRIEEYIPEELGRLDDEPNISAEPAVDKTESTPTQDELSAPEEIIAESLPDELMPFGEVLTLETPPEPATASAAPSPTADLSAEIAPEPDLSIGAPAVEEFTPLDEALTFEEPVEPATPSGAAEVPGEISLETNQSAETPVAEEFTPLDETLTFETPPAAPAETAELPGEISPELLQEPEPAPPAVVAAPAAPQKDLAPGAQHEMFFEEAPPRAPEPETVSMESAPAALTEPTVPEPPAPADKSERPVEAKQERAVEALPTIEVEESLDDKDYFATAPSGEATPPASGSEETIALDVEINAPEIIAPPVAETPAPPAAAEPATAPESPTAPAKPAGEKIILEIVSEPTPEKPRDKYSVDFDLSDLTPPLPDEPELSPPETSPTAQGEVPVATESAPVPAETATPPPKPPVVKAETDTPAKTEPPQQAMETATPEPPASNNLDDIPVLNEVVAPPAGGVPTAKPTAPLSASPPLPARPDRAREVVVRAVAKLNVEMRKTGGAGLDTKTILRLQQLIRQELEKSGEK